MALLRRRRRKDAGSGMFSAGWDVPAQFNFTRDVVEALASDPTRSALTFVDREGIVDRRTFNDLAKDAARWAHLLRTRIDRGDRALFVLGKTPAWHGAMLGALKSGVVAVPCADMLRARDLAFRARDSGAKLVVADRHCQVEVDEMRNQIGDSVPVVYVDEAQSELGRYMPVAKTEETGALDTAFILYTSGTTKDPKGVVHTHAYTWAKRMQASHWLDAHERDVVWCTAGTGWAKAIWNALLGPWSQGAEIVLHEGAFDPEERLALVQRLGVTVLCQAPTEYRLLAKLDKLGTTYMPRLRHLVSAGEPLNPEVISLFQDTLGLTVHDGYGQTENSLLVANSPGAPVRPGSMGTPTPGHDVAVIDEAGHVCPTGVEGDIALIGRPPTLFRGYWNDREQTEAVFRDGWYVTGDRAFRDEEGYLWFVGRSDDVILSAAYRIGPFEVESALLEHPAVAESAVIGAPDPDRGQVVKAFVVLRSGHEASERLASELQAHVKTVTAPYKYPRAVAFVEELPKTASGKIKRSELRAPDAPAVMSALTIVPRDAEVIEAEAREAGAIDELAARRERERAEAQAAAEREAEALERARADAEAAARARLAALEAARREAEETARLEAEEEARLEAEATARFAAEDAARREAQAAARRETEEAARREAGEAERQRAEAEAAERARLEAEAAERARLEAEEAERQRLEAETAEQARLEAEATARREAEEAAHREAEEAARREAEEAERIRLEAEEAAWREAEEAERIRLEAEAAARQEAEEAARREAEEAERALAAAAEAARLEEEEAARRAAEEAERLRVEAEEAARVQMEEAARLEAEIAARAEAERALAEARLLELEEEALDVGEAATAEEPEPEPGESRWAARRRRREEAAMAKAVAEEARRQAKADAEQRKRYEQDAKADARRRAAEEKEAERRRAEEDRLRAEEDKRRAEEEKREAKRRAEEARQREIRERAAAKLRDEEERRAGRAARRGGLRLRRHEDEFDQGDEPVEPIPDIVERLRRYSGDIAYGTTIEAHERETGTTLEEPEREEQHQQR